MGTYESLNHTQWECLYHVVFIPKCRRRTLGDWTSNQGATQNRGTSVKDALGCVADGLAPTDPARATRLRRASTHWLRHTAASHPADAGTPIHHIPQNLRHASVATSSIYLHTEEARHASTVLWAGIDKRKTTTLA